MLLNEAIIYWVYKKQNLCETSNFGSEFFAMKQAVECFRGFRYKIRMFDIPFEDPTFVYGNNHYVISNTLTLKNNSNSVAFHLILEGCVCDERRTTYVNTHENLAYLLTNPLPSGEKRWRFVRRLIYRL